MSVSMKGIRWYWPLLGAAVILLGASIVYMLTASRPLSPRAGEREAIAEEVAAPSAVAPSPPASGRWVAGNCVVEPRGELREVAGNAGGRIASISVREGDFVRAGEVLAELSAESERAAVAAARADAEQAGAELALARAGTRTEEIRATRAEARAANARAELSQGVFERLKEAQGGGVTEDELERARLEARADQAKAASAKAQLRQAIEGTRKEEIAQAEAGHDAAKARADEAEAALAARRTESPIAGEVLEVAKRSGEYHQPGEPLVIVGDTRSLRVRMEVDERDVGLVRAGARARVWVPGHSYDAEIAHVGQRVKPKAIASEDPGERSDARVLEVLLDPDRRGELVVGQRGVCYTEAEQGEREELEEPAAAPR